MVYYPIITTAIAVISAGASTGAAIWKQKKLEESIDKLSKTVTVEVEDDYIHQIVEKAVKKDGILGGSSTVVVDGKTKYTVKNNEGFCKLDNYGLTKKGSTSCIANYSFTDAVIASLTK